MSLKCKWTISQENEQFNGKSVNELLNDQSLFEPLNDKSEWTI